MIRIERTNSNNLLFKDLVKLLDKELWERYGNNQQAYVRYNHIENIETVIIAIEELKLVGCGCFKSIDNQTVEIKRMFVKKEFRGKGISKKILIEIENWAR